MKNWSYKYRQARKLIKEQPELSHLNPDNFTREGLYKELRKKGFTWFSDSYSWKSESPINPNKEALPYYNVTVRVPMGMYQDVRKEAFNNGQSVSAWFEDAAAKKISGCLDPIENDNNVPDEYRRIIEEINSKVETILSQLNQLF